MQLHLNTEKRELKQHGSYAFPVCISDESLSKYERGAFSWHWHPEIELTLCLEGEMIYQINERVYRLKQGEGLFCNSNALHAGHMEQGDCRYMSLTFHPRLLFGFEGSLIQKEYTDPILQSQIFTSCLLAKESEWQEKVLIILRNIWESDMKKQTEWPLTLQVWLLQIWSLLFTNGYRKMEQTRTMSTEGRDMERIRTVLDYLHSHYSGRITLEEIAELTNLCRSECCRFFKRYMGQSLFTYLTEYRIEKSLMLLAGSELSITEIALQCGFSSPAYFTKIFREKTGVTPMEYRRNMTGDNKV